MIKDEALKLMAIAIEEGWSFDRIDGEVYPAIKEALAQPERDYERGFIDGMQKQMQSSVDKAVNAMTQPTYYIPNKDEREWVGLTDDEIWEAYMESPMELDCSTDELYALSRTVEAKLRSKNNV